MSARKTKISDVLPFHVEWRSTVCRMVKKKCKQPVVDIVSSFYYIFRNFPQGTISDMVEDASEGISFVCNQIASFGGDPSRSFSFPKKLEIIFSMYPFKLIISHLTYLFLTQVVNNQIFLTDTQGVGMAGVSFYSFLEHTGSVRLSF